MSLQTVGNPGSTNQLTTATRTFYSRTLIETLFHWLVLVPFGVVRDIPLKAGQTIDWRAFGRLSAATTALTEGTPPAGSNLTITNVTAVVEQYGDFIKWSDKLLDTGPDPYVTEALKLQAAQIALTFDTLVQTAIFAGTNVTYGGNATARNNVDSSDVFAFADLDSCVKSLKSRHVMPVTKIGNPSTGVDTKTIKAAFIAPVTPAIWKVIKGTSNYSTLVTGVEKYASNIPTLPNELGCYDQVRFIETTNGLYSATGGASSGPVHIMPIFGENGFAISRLSGKAIVPVVKDIDVPDSNDPLGQMGLVGWKAYFVAKIIDQDRFQRYEFYGA